LALNTFGSARWVRRAKCRLGVKAIPNWRSVIIVHGTPLVAARKEPAFFATFRLKSPQNQLLAPEKFRLTLLESLTNSKNRTTRLFASTYWEVPICPCGFYKLLGGFFIFEIFFVGPAFSITYSAVPFLAFFPITHWSPQLMLCCHQ
jgi:hypothetical protein